MKKTIKKITCALLATMSVFGCAATMSGCTTAYPEVKMEIAFNGETYTLEYVLQRNVAPATVEHFLWLADNGYYDGLAVHNYDTTNFRMHTGAYSLGEEETNLVYKEYYDVIKGYKNFEQFPNSVWQDNEKTLPTYTLKGEFADNHFEVESGALQEKFGSLTMYYEALPTSAAERKVSIQRASDGELDRREYKYNHTTSAFFISMTTNSKNNASYCTFAYLDEESEDELKALQTAINEYIDSNYGEDKDDFTKSVSTVIFDDETMFSATQTVSYKVPTKAIVINEVSVTKF